MASLFQNLLSIASAERVKGTINKFVCTVNNINHCEKIALEEVQVPFTWYQITTLNNAIRFNDGTQRDVTIPIGVYTPTTIAAAIQSAMNSSPSALTFAITYDNIAKKLTIVETSGPTVYLLQFNIPNSLGIVAGYGFVDFSAASSYTATNILNLSHNNFMFNVKSRALTRYNNRTKTTDKKDPMLRLTNGLTQWGGLITHENIKDVVFDFNPGGTLTHIDIEITDAQDNVIDFGGIDEVVLTFKYYTRI